MPVERKEQNAAIILSAGRGKRMGSGTAKQYLDLCGMPVIAWSLKAFEEFDGVDNVILVTAPEEIGFCRTEIVDRYRFRKVSGIVPGGAERYLSVWEGLKEVHRLCGPKRSPSYVFIHDGARPLVEEKILSRCLADVRRHGACVAGMPVKDTIKEADEEAFAVRTPDRSRLCQIQTPQTFSFPLVFEAYRKLIEEGITDVTDDAMVVERETDVRVKLTEGSWRNLKLTTPEDLKIAGLFLGEK
jgi:2-C-methyl-D-erythritol 4-phosphate cytidylyltransferase